jgi:hypothetical protein
MGKILTMTILCFVFSGCDSLRFAPGELQKQNAWLHNRTAIVTAEAARAENASEKLKSLTQLSELQSRSFVAFCGLPKEFPKAETADDILQQANWQLAGNSLAESAERPDGWQLADNAIEIAIGLCALFGGAYGVRLAQFLKTARDKSKALKEIIEGNEFFKDQNSDAVAAFKAAHKDQSPATRQIVAQAKIGM